jgi:GNAT superfamily N-acetyltransferase
VQHRPLHLTDARDLALLVERADARRRDRPAPIDPPTRGPNTPERWARTLASAGGMALGGDDGGRLIAAAVAAPMHADHGHGDVVDEWAHLHLLATDPDHWGRGAASSLIAHLDLVLTEAGHHHVALWTQRDNLRARRFYERRGWTRSRRLPALSAQGETLVHYERTLSPHRWRPARPIAR